MRNVLFAIAILFSLSVCAQNKQLSWKKDLNVATELSKSENKPMLVYFSKTNCNDCQQFYNDFFKQPEFDAVADRFVLVMVDGSDLTTKTNNIEVLKQRRLLQHYNPSSTFPAILALNHNKELLGELYTSKDKNDMANYLAFIKTL